MPLRALTGGQVAASAWVLPDESIIFVQLTQKEFDAGGVDTLRAPHPSARFIMAIGGMPELDTPDGYPSPGDYWEQEGVDQNGKPAMVLHYQTGTDYFGQWSHSMQRDGKEYLSQIVVSHRDLLLNYDLKTIDQYVPKPPISQKDFGTAPLVRMVIDDGI